MKADARTEAEVKAVLDRMAEGYAKKDLDMMSIWSILSYLSIRFFVYFVLS